MRFKCPVSPTWVTLALAVCFFLLSGCADEQPANSAATQSSEPRQPVSAQPPASVPSSRPAPTSPVASSSSLQEQPASGTQLKIVHWNIESGGSHPTLIASQLRQFVNEGYQLIALSEVHEYRVYEDMFDSIDEDDRWQSLLGASGINPEREDDRLMIFFDASRLKVISSQELNRYDDYRLNDGRHRSPLVAHFHDRESDEDFLLLHNHLARGNAGFRQEQAAGLREFARNNSLPLIAVGDYNFDFVFETRQGNPAFSEFMRDGVWHWVEPAELIDTNWFDPEPDGIDNYPGSMLDFSFVAGPARDWSVTSRVIVRDGDFPDDEKTSDHRPVEVLVRY